MRWVVFALLVLNVGVWQLGDYAKVGGQPSTVATGSLPRVASLRVQDIPSVVPESGARVCMRLGWFDSVDAADELKAGSAFAGAFSFKVEEVERPLPSLHWIIVPPQPPSAALAQFREMQKQGVDSYLVTEGENKNAISLGLFESRSAAISVLEEKKRKNFNVVLVNFDRNQISYALSIETEPGLAKEMVQAVKADYERKFDFVEVNRCEGVATPENNP